MGNVLGAVAKFGNATTTVLLAWVFLARGRKGLVGSKRGARRKSVFADGVDGVTELTQILQCVTFDALFLGAVVRWGHTVKMLLD
jgi:hypothetical protein